MDKKSVPVSETGTKAVHTQVMENSVSQEHTCERLNKVTSDWFAGVQMDLWTNENGDIFMTGEQIGKALDYSYPVQAIHRLYERHARRFKTNSVVVKLITTDGKSYDTRVFNEKGIYEIIRKSGQPKADEFYDWVYQVLEQIRTNGIYAVPSASPTQSVNERTVRTELLKSALEHEERINTLEERIATVEQNVTLSHGEQRALQRAIGRRVYELERDAECRSELFRQAHREIRDRWGVASYRDVRRIELQEVLNYVRAWKPRMQLVG